MEIFGYKIFKRKEIDSVFFNKLKSLSHFFDKKDKLIIFDIGANIGQSVNIYKEKFPDSTIHSFEPDNESFNILASKKIDNVIYNNIALGSNNETKVLNKYSDSANNSFYNLNENSISITSGVHPKVLNCIKKEHFTQECFTTTLDEYLKHKEIKKINIMKIDVQGYENDVLIGSLDTLKKAMVDIIIVEIIFDDIYGKGNSFYKIESIIAPHGYMLWDISHIYKDLNLNKTSWVDAIYIHKTLIHTKD